MAVELFWFIRKQYRGGRAAVVLLKKFEGWAASKGCRRVTMVHLENDASDGLPKFYMRMGYSPLETHYIKEL